MSDPCVSQSAYLGSFAGGHVFCMFVDECMAWPGYPEVAVCL